MFVLFVFLVPLLPLPLFFLPFFLPLTTGLPISSGFTLKKNKSAYPYLLVRWETMVSLTN